MRSRTRFSPTTSGARCLRWADEGGAVLSEDGIERNRHDRLCRNILNTPGRAMSPAPLFALREYPNDVMALYAQGFSVVNFLVDTKAGKPSCSSCMMACSTAGTRPHERTTAIRAWTSWSRPGGAHLLATKGQPLQLARGMAPGSGGARSNTFVRQTLPPTQPFPVQPTAEVRGQGADSTPGTFRDAARQLSSRPGYLPDHDPARPMAASSEQARGGDGWGPATSAPDPRPTVTLGAIQVAPDPPSSSTTAPQAQLGKPIPSRASPVGYPYN